MTQVNFGMDFVVFNGKPTLWEGFWGIEIFGTKIANISYKFEMRLITFTITN